MEEFEFLHRGSARPSKLNCFPGITFFIAGKIDLSQTVVYDASNFLPYLKPQSDGADFFVCLSSSQIRRVR